MKFDAIAGAAPREPGRLSMRCPGCRENGVFEPSGIHDLVILDNGTLLGLRICPKVECRTIVFIAQLADGTVISEPREVIDFDSTDIPANVTSALEEAITCHANGCYRAAAIMVRRTLEELCAEKKAEGPNLAAKIQALSGVVIIPPALLDGIDDIRLFGNDAAHLEARVYDEIGSTEVAVVIDFTKEVLKAIYQSEALLGRLRALRPTSAP